MRVRIPDLSGLSHSMKIVDFKIPLSLFYNFVQNVLWGRNPINTPLKIWRKIS